MIDRELKALFPSIERGGLAYLEYLQNVADPRVNHDKVDRAVGLQKSLVLDCDLAFEKALLKADVPTIQGVVIDIEAETVRNRDYRRVLYTGPHVQLVLMSLRPGEEIGQETHPVDQFFRIEAGRGEVEINGRKSAVKANMAFVIPAKAKHNVRNTGKKRLQLYTIYGPPHHRDALVVARKTDEVEEHFDGRVTEAGVKKALPRKDPKAKPVKRQDSGKAEKKQAGAGGRTRYTYPGERTRGKQHKNTPKVKPRGQAAQQAQHLQAMDDKAKPHDPVPGIQESEQPTPKTVDPSEIANKLGMPVATLQRIAQRFKDHPKLHGVHGFVAFMGKQLGPFAAKHNLDRDYFGMLYQALTGGTTPTPST